MAFLEQLGGASDMISQMIFFAMFFAFAFLYPRLTLSQTIWKIEKDAIALEAMAVSGREAVSRSIQSRPSSRLKESIRNFMEFFAITPVDMDPYGIVKKLDMVVRQSDRRFKAFVSQTAPDLNQVQQDNVQNALSGAMLNHQIAKVVRHYLETIKKYKILQLAMLIQMQMPLIVRAAKAASAATRAFLEGLPIGDSIGPLVAASLIPKGTKAKVYREEEFAVAAVKIKGRKVFVAKADGPGAGTGYPGKFLLKFTGKQRIDRLITVDAALRLEGEKAGTVAEGVGVAIGGPGVDRYEIEEFALKHSIPLDAVAIKVSDEEALGPLKPEIMKGIAPAMEAINGAVERGKKNERILLIGVGNTCGVGNGSAAAKVAEEMIKKYAKKAAEQKKVKSN